MSTLPKDDALRAPRPPGKAEIPGSGERPGVPVPPPPASVARPFAPPTPPAMSVAPATPASFSPGTIVDGRYRVIRFLNQGGAGMVHEVEHLRTGRRLAMKSLVDDANAARLEQEARATALMKNPHVVRITDMGPAAGNTRVAPYLVMELLEGQSLRELLDEAGQLPLELTVNIALQVCDCLAEAHERSVVHRDLKPENLFLQKSAWPNQYDVVVLDFGVMKIAGEGPIPKGSLTRTGSTVGTPYYMSLEQLRNSSGVDARADIYSLGVVLYECLAGRKPFQADTIGDLVYALCSGPPTALARLRPDLPADVCDAVMRALKMNREDRQPSMAELGAALLPHGHPAFGLWLRAKDASGTGLTPFGGLADPARRPIPSMPQIGPVPTMIVAPAPPTPDEGEGTTVTAVAPKQLDVEDSVTSDGMPTGKVAPKRQDRDTPTEMYRAVSFGGDRDTPTRALPAPSLPELDAALARAGAQPVTSPPPAMGSSPSTTGALPAMNAPPPGPQGTSADQAPTFRMDNAPRFGSSTERMIEGGVLTAAPTFSGGRPPDAPPPPPRFDAPPDPRATSQQGEPRVTGTYAAAMVPDGGKPGWQRSLDTALASVGGSIEGLVKKVRAQPPAIQYAVVATIGLVVLLVLVLVVVLVLR
ncbi:MAG: protein kinase [Polyangiaceae bacterium]